KGPAAAAADGDHVGTFCSRLVEDALLELRRRRRRVGAVRQHGRGLAQARQIVAAALTAGEMGLEVPLLAFVERVERVRRDEGMRVSRHHKKYGARSSAPRAYQAPNARLSSASAGARRSNEPRSGADAS